ncbi:16128_t:CDS:2 [Racocetra persica]|uniref:16128_t:CDS:1 n=1 Tax=Racocetra persica TaxID=160502 RepID=A0ACA9LU12_9GLOM|nr:16128_t:CDS:2 [Racocetra persica]
MASLHKNAWFFPFILGITLLAAGYYVINFHNIIELASSQSHYENYLNKGLGNSDCNCTAPKRTQKVPKILHYVYLNEDPASLPFNFTHWLAFTSAIETIKPEKTYFHCIHEPKSYWYQLIKPKVSIMKTRIVTKIFGNPVNIIQHKSDIIRMEVLRDFGGIYLDLDVIVLQPFDDLLYYDFTMGIEKTNQSTLCNAAIVSRPFAPFLTRWMLGYKDFDDSDWSRHSIRLPYNMSKVYSNDIHVLNATAFFWPTWMDEHLDLAYASNNYNFSNQYIYHMWSTKSYYKYLQYLSPKSIKSEETSFNRVVRKFLNYLPKDFNEKNFDFDG